MSQKFDAIIIGAGQAGPSLAVKLANHGKKVALIERDRFGGTCVNTGCIPTKTLIASAHAAHVVEQAEKFGVNVHGSVEVDMKKVKHRKDVIVSQISSDVETWLRNTPNCTVIKGHARFDSPHTIQVGEEKFEGEQIFINVGARAFVPPIPGLDQVKFYTNSSMMTVDFIPEHLLIVGGSYIGLEFAQMYRRFGSKVTIIEKADRLIPREDFDVSEAVKGILDKEDIEIRLNTNCIQVAKEGNHIAVTNDCATKKEKIVGTHLLLAIGRQPNTQDLDLDKAGVATDERHFIKVDDSLRTNVTHIWALGECNGKGAFTHTSYNDYEIAADNLVDKGKRRISDRILAYALYIDPPLGRAGMTEAEAKALGKKYKIAKRPMTQVKRAMIKGDTQGFMKAIIDAETNQILGAAILGLGGDEIIHSLLDVMYAKGAYPIIKNAVHIHPTVSELIPTMLGEMTMVEA